MSTGCGRIGQKSPEVRYSSKTHVSYAFGSFFDDFSSTAFSIRVYAFYETEVLLPSMFLVIAFVIYGIWNMLDDPLVGYISDRRAGFTRRRGKRFTWFIITAFPCAILFTFIFAPPNSDVLGTFLWLLASICAFDFFFSFWDTNWMAIFPDKFRSQKERTKIAAIQTLLSQLGLTLGMLLPPLFFTYGNRGSYLTQAAVVSIICLMVAVVMLHGMRDDPESMKRTLRLEATPKQRESYFETLKLALKQKNFVAYLLAYLGQTVMMVVMLASIPYLVRYILGVGSGAETYIAGALLLGGACSVPFWIKIARRYGNRIGYMCGTGLTATLLLLFLFFVSSLETAIIGAALLGITMGATWSLLYPTFSDVIDEIVLKTKDRKEAIYYGFRTFFGRLSIVIQAVTFALIHFITGFDPVSSVQSGPALLGLRFQMTIVPMLFYLIGFLCMWRIYDLRPAKVQSIKSQLKSLGL
jgi:GPH family glycoside/pentoside/hexuronide:cation symporter